MKRPVEALPRIRPVLFMLGSMGVCDEWRVRGHVLPRHRTKFLTNFRTPWKKKQRSDFPSCFFFFFVPLKVVFEIHIWKECFSLYTFRNPTVGCLYRSRIQTASHLEEKAHLSVQLNCLKSQSHNFRVLILYNNESVLVLKHGYNLLCLLQHFSPAVFLVARNKPLLNSATAWLFISPAGWQAAEAS